MEQNEELFRNFLDGEPVLPAEQMRKDLEREFGCIGHLFVCRAWRRANDKFQQFTVRRGHEILLDENCRERIFYESEHLFHRRPCSVIEG